MICTVLIPSFIDEEGSERVKNWFKDSSESILFTSWLTLFEFETVLRQKLLQKLITSSQYDSIQHEWISFQSNLNLVALDSRSSRQGLRFQKLYNLKPYDSIQLGCASLIQVEYPDIQLACLDQRLLKIATQEGFRILSY